MTPIWDEIIEASRLASLELHTQTLHKFVPTSIVLKIMDREFELLDILMPVWWRMAEDLKLDPSLRSERLREDAAKLESE